MEKFKIYQSGHGQWTKYYVCVDEFSKNNWINYKGEVVDWDKTTCEYHSRDKAQQVLDAYMKRNNEVKQDFYRIEKDGPYLRVAIGVKYLQPEGDLLLSTHSFLNMSEVFLALSKYSQDQKQIGSYALYKKFGEVIDCPVVFENGDQKLNFSEIVEDSVKKQIIVKLKPLYQTN